MILTPAKPSKAPAHNALAQERRKNIEANVYKMEKKINKQASQACARVRELDTFARRGTGKPRSRFIDLPARAREAYEFLVKGFRRFN